LDAPGQFQEDKKDFWFKEVPGFEKKMTKDAAKKKLKKEFQKAKNALMVLCINGRGKKRQKNPRGTMY
jgi:hypothetical protein